LGRVGLAVAGAFASIFDGSENLHSIADMKNRRLSVIEDRAPIAASADKLVYGLLNSCSWKTIARRIVVLQKQTFSRHG
jgi:hypothetical protein